MRSYYRCFKCGTPHPEEEAPDRCPECDGYMIPVEDSLWVYAISKFIGKDIEISRRSTSMSPHIAMTPRKMILLDVDEECIHVSQKWPTELDGSPTKDAKTHIGVIPRSEITFISCEMEEQEACDP